MVIATSIFSTYIKGRQCDRLYQTHINQDFKKIPLKNNITDTKNCIEHFMIGSISITIHNFLYGLDNQKPRPMDQIERWLNQYPLIKNGYYEISCIKINGFCGYKLEGSSGKESIIAVALELDKGLITKIINSLQNIESIADITIKAIGSKEEMNQFRDDIISMIEHFQLIEEIPS